MVTGRGAFERHPNSFEFSISENPPDIGVWANTLSWKVSEMSFLTLRFISPSDAPSSDTRTSPSVRAMSSGPVVVVDGAAVDGMHPASPSDWLKTLPQLGAYTTGRTRGGATKMAQWSSHVARLRSSLAALTGTTFGSDGEVAALIEPTVRKTLAECAARNVAGPTDDGTSTQPSVQSSTHRSTD